jgi:apolipoprotein N-acyltransferase
MMLAIWLTGLGLQQINWTEAEGDKLTVTLIQPNIAQNQKWSADFQASILQQLYQQSETHWNSDLILWPEAAIPTVAEQIPQYMEQLKSKAIATKSTLLTGIIHYDPTEKKYYNSILALGDADQRYDKTRLVPFGEYVPLEFLLRGTLDFFRLPVPALSLGKPYQKSFIVNQQNIGASICYEVVYPDLIARISNNANILLTVSNDTWFGDSIGPHQHMQMVRMRAMETAKPMIRATNNGITGFVDYKGQITQVSPRNLMTELTARVQPREGRTLFSQTGSWPTIILSLSLLICFVLIRQRRI